MNNHADYSIQLSPQQKLPPLMKCYFYPNQNWIDESFRWWMLLERCWITFVEIDDVKWRRLRRRLSSNRIASSNWWIGEWMRRQCWTLFRLRIDCQDNNYFRYWLFVVEKDVMDADQQNCHYDRHRSRCIPTIECSVSVRTWGDRPSLPYPMMVL